MRIKALWLVYILTIVLPGLLLAYFGLRALRQDRLSSDRQIRERMDRIADETVVFLENILNGWREALDRWPAEEPVRHEDIPKALFRIVEPDGAGAVIKRSASGLRVYPENALAFVPRSEEALASEARPLPAALAAAEAAEIKEGNPQKAIATYSGLLTSAPEHRPWILTRLGRSYRKAGRKNEALAVFRELQKDPPAIVGSLPAQLIAGYEICSILAETGPSSDLAREALEVYGDLTVQPWKLDEYQYAYYSDGLRAWLEAGSATGEFARLRVREVRKIALSVAARQTAREPRSVNEVEGGPILAVWNPDPFVACLAGPLWFESEIWPDLLAAVKAGDFDLLLATAAGAPIAGTPPSSSAAAGISRGLDGLGLPWRLRIQPRPGNTLSADLHLRQNLTLAVLILMLAVLLFGGYLTIRTTRKEIEVARLKTDFVSTVSHEFRSPLTGIRQLAGLLRDGRVKDEAGRREYFEMICDESDRLSRLVENLLDFSRMEDGRKEYRFGRLETGPFLAGIVSAFEAAAVSRGISIETSLPDGLPGLVGDAEALTLAIHNLLDNAVKYSPAGESIRLEAEAANGLVIIRVKDRGAGIPEDEQPRVFDKFFRGRNARDEGIKGAGLGLALVREIIRAHGGTASVESRRGEGSAFIVELPAAKNGPDARAPNPQG